MEHPRQSRPQKGEVFRFVAYHGTDRMDFTRFDVSRAGLFNIGLHFGTKAAASRIAFLRKENPSAPCRILIVAMTVENPLRKVG